MQGGGEARAASGALLREGGVEQTADWREELERLEPGRVSRACRDASYRVHVHCVVSSGQEEFLGGANGKSSLQRSHIIFALIPSQLNENNF